MKNAKKNNIFFGKIWFPRAILTFLKKIEFIRRQAT